jgi:hypothetical protein
MAKEVRERDKENITIAVDPATRERLAQIAAAEQRTLSGQVRYLMLKGLEQVRGKELVA